MAADEGLRSWPLSQPPACGPTLERPWSELNEEQHETLGDLIEEGMENQIAIAGAMAILGKA